MTTLFSRQRPMGLTVLTAFCLITLAAQPALARDRQSHVTGPQGHSATRDVSRVQGDVSSSTTGANGKTLAARNVDRSASGTTGSVTGPQGKSASRQTTRTDTGSSTTVTGPSGQTGTVTVTR
jgi:hypothetical protein